MSPELLLVGGSRVLLSALCLPEHSQPCGRKGMEQLCVCEHTGRREKQGRETTIGCGLQLMGMEYSEIIL